MVSHSSCSPPGGYLTPGPPLEYIHFHLGPDPVVGEDLLDCHPGAGGYLGFRDESSPSRTCSQTSAQTNLGRSPLT